MKRKLNWFDKLMVAVTFAEAGVEEPKIENSVEKGNGHQGYSHPDSHEVNPAANPYLKAAR